MTSILIAIAIFSCILVGVVLGAALRQALPEHHLQEESKDAVKLCAGLIATLTALVLGLLIASAKSSYDAVNNGLVQSSAKVVGVDRTMAQYGPETDEARRLLRCGLASAIARIWPEDGVAFPGDNLDTMNALQQMHYRLRSLSPQNDTQRVLQSQALAQSDDLAQSRWQILQLAEARLPTPFLVVLAFWLMVLFASFSLFSPRNVTVTVVFGLCALSVSGAIFLVQEMSRPSQGTMKVSSAPLVHAYSLLQQTTTQPVVRFPTTVPGQTLGKE